MHFLGILTIITVFVVPSNCWQFNYYAGGNCDDTNSELAVDTEIGAGSGAGWRYEKVKYFIDQINLCYIKIFLVAL